MCCAYSRTIARHFFNASPDINLYTATAVEGPKAMEPIGNPNAHTYLLVTDGRQGYIVDGTISQFFSQFEDLSAEVLGIRQSYFVGTRDELRRLTAKASENTLRYAREYGSAFGIDASKIRSLSDLDVKTPADRDILNKLFAYNLVPRDGTSAPPIWNGICSVHPDYVPQPKTNPGYPIIIGGHVKSQIFERSWGTKSRLQFQHEGQEIHIDLLRNVFAGEVAISLIGVISPHEPNKAKKRWRNIAMIAYRSRQNEPSTIPLLPRGEAEGHHPRAVIHPPPRTREPS